MCSQDTHILNKNDSDVDGMVSLNYTTESYKSSDVNGMVSLNYSTESHKNETSEYLLLLLLLEFK